MIIRKGKRKIRVFTEDEKKPLENLPKKKSVVDVKEKGKNKK